MLLTALGSGRCEGPTLWFPGRGTGMGPGRGHAGCPGALTLICRCSRKNCSRQALRLSARTRSWPLGDLIHGLRCWGRRGFNRCSLGQPPSQAILWAWGPVRQVRVGPLDRASPIPSFCPAGLAHSHGHPWWTL